MRPQPYSMSPVIPSSARLPPEPGMVLQSVPSMVARALILLRSLVLPLSIPVSGQRPQRSQQFVAAPDNLPTPWATPSMPLHPMFFPNSALVRVVKFSRFQMVFLRGFPQQALPAPVSQTKWLAGRVPTPSAPASYMTRAPQLALQPTPHQPPLPFTAPLLSPAIFRQPTLRQREQSRASR